MAMVAYNFQKQFADAIQSAQKRQTVRTIRKNGHARIGEKLQLYTGLRTKACCKLIDSDPICTGVDEVEIHIKTTAEIEKIIVGKKELNNQEIEEFAAADGFKARASYSARNAMATFFQKYHGNGIFRGNVIRWEVNNA